MIVKSRLSEYFQTLSELLANIKVTGGKGISLSLDRGIEKAVAMIQKIKNGGKKIILIGNGGSSAIASHAQADLCNAAGVQALVFHETPLLTALSNDYGYAEVFDRSIKLWANPGDLVIAISSGGKSENILRGVQSALTNGVQVMTFSGFAETNPLRQKGHLNFYVGSNRYGHVETAHGALVHFLTDCCAEESR